MKALVFSSGGLDSTTAIALAVKEYGHKNVISLVVGSANMDYRSLYLHFENCCAFYGGKMVQDVRRDIERCMTQSREVTIEDVDHTPWPKRLFQLFLRLFAPLL